MTIAQIYAIIALLLAFNVPQQTVDNVQTILQNANGISVQTSVPAQTESPIFGAIPDVQSVAQDCTPSIIAGVQKIAGSIETGTDFRFTGTTTIPVGCSIDKAENMVLQKPDGGKYIGKVADEERNGNIKNIQNGFVYTRGYGFGSGITPTGDFVWTVGSVSTTTSIK